MVTTNSQYFTNNRPDVEVYDIEKAKQRVNDFLGFEPPPKTCGYLVCVALFTKKEEEGVLREDGTRSAIIAPDSRTKEEKYRTNTGMVIQMGDLAYKGATFADTGPWCRIGDWVTIPRHEGTQVNYRGHALFYIYDDKIMNVLDDPSYMKRGDY